MKKFFLATLSLVMLMSFFSCKQEANKEFAFQDTLIWGEDNQPLTQIPDEFGVAGPYVGISNGALIVAGGANFQESTFTSTSSKVYYDTINVMMLDDENCVWTEQELKLPQAMGYGASLQTSNGLLCVGGNNNDSKFAASFFLEWDKATEAVVLTEGPALPVATTAFQGTMSGSTAFIAGGLTDNGVSNQFLSLDTTATTNEWTAVEGFIKADNKEDNETISGVFPAPARKLAVMATQFNGRADSVYIISGRDEVLDADGKIELVPFKDVIRYTPKTGEWLVKDDAPVAMMAGSAASIGMGHIFVLSGTDGAAYESVKSGAVDMLDHPGFPKIGWAYSTITDTWVKACELPANQLTTPIVRTSTNNNSAMYLVSGEVKPKIRSNNVWKITVKQEKNAFGAINFSIIVIYLLGIVGIGVFFYFRNKNAADFFTGGGRIPFWVAAFSIFATMLSSITFVAVPGKVFGTDWVNYALNFTLLCVTPAVVIFFLPFFRRIKSASAYEYLETRFNIGARMFGSTCFIIYHIGRMAIVMYLPALALSTVLTLHQDPQMNMVICIAIMGLLSVIYCSMGGLEAVVWTDTIQSFVLLGGAIVTIIVICVSLKDPAAAFSGAVAEGKMTMVNWDWAAWKVGMVPAFWVIFLGGIGQNLVPYASDMAVIQRYMSVEDEAGAKKSIWTNMFISLIAGALFFLVGTALYVFYKENPANLAPTAEKLDATFPLFIARELPVGVAGLVVAAIFAAAQSTVSTSINSATAAITTDYVQRFNLVKGTKEEIDRKELNIARMITIVFGVVGTITAVIFVFIPNKSLWDTFMAMLGLILGAMCGLFCLGIFTKRANGVSALIGVAAGVVGTFLFQKLTPVHPYLYAIINITITFVVGYLVSFIVVIDQGTKAVDNSINYKTFFKKTK